MSDDKWDIICNLSEPPKWGYELDVLGKKILAKKFEFENTTIYDFTTHRIERMIDESWSDPTNNGADAYILAEILEAYLTEDVLIDWVEGFPMPSPNVDDFDFSEEFDFDSFV
jgi:hypothetical protein